MVGCTPFVVLETCLREDINAVYVTMLLAILYLVGALSADLLVDLLPSERTTPSSTRKHLPETNKNSIKNIDLSQTNTKLNSAECKDLETEALIPASTYNRTPLPNKIREI